MSPGKIIRPRFDYILIWGHGLKHQSEILDMLENTPGVEIQKIFLHQTRSIKKLVDQIYSHDYAPIHHLKSKVKYLLSTPNKVLFIFFKNNSPRVDYHGEGSYRHEESGLIRDLKENIRNRFNPKNEDGSRTENHVIHASDSTEQTGYALNILGIDSGIKFLEQSSIWSSDKTSENYSRKTMVLEMKSIDELHAEIVFKFGKKIVRIHETPHYSSLVNDMNVYEKYLAENLGLGLNDFVSVSKFKKMSESSGSPQSENLIIAKKTGGKLLVQEGLHQVAIYLSRGVNKIPLITMELP